MESLTVEEKLGNAVKLVMELVKENKSLKEDNLSIKSSIADIQFRLAALELNAKPTKIIETKPEVPKQQIKKVEEKILTVSKTEDRFERQFEKLKNTINLKNPSRDDVKRILGLKTQFSKEKTIECLNKAKVERRKKFPRAKRYEQMQEYITYSSNSLAKLQEAVMEVDMKQNQIFKKYGFNEQSMLPQVNEFPLIMQELALESSSACLEDVKRALHLKSKYLKSDGEKLFNRIIEVGMKLSPEQKMMLPMSLNVILNDELFENEPKLDSEEVEIGVEKYREELAEELSELETIMNPLVMNLHSRIMGDFGGMNFFEGLNNSGNKPSIV